MAGAGTLVYTLESRRIDDQVREQVEQEVSEFRTLQREGVDPETGKRFNNVNRLLEVFLTRNVPDDDEMIVRYAGNKAEARTANRFGREILNDPRYLDVIPGLLKTGGSTRFESTNNGQISVTVVQVRNDSSEGALTMIHFLDEEHAEINRTMRTYALVALLSLVFITLLARWQAGRLLAPLRHLRETAEDVTTHDLSVRIPESGNDDITALTRTFNGMLDRLETGFTSQRQFLDDAGHELRTPLTVLRGHLELVDAHDPADVEETRALLLDELDRMSRLVGDMLLLAKSSRPDFVTHGPVALDLLVQGVLTKATVLADRDWVDDGAPTLDLAADEQRLTQALLQLADNAVKHTGVGDLIAIGAAADDREVQLWVRDSGPGVPVADRERIFGRFERSHVPEGDEGFGLGLSIVRAVAEAHGGRVAVEDGARFVITIPREDQPWLGS